MSYATDFVRYALSIGALELVPEGRKLKSGRISPYFFNSGLFNTGETISQLATAYAGAMKNAPSDVIFGPSYKAIPIAVATAMRLGGNVGYAYNRKEAKDHGEGGIIIGASLKDKTVDLVDDVMTTGESLAEAIDIVRVAGGIPTRCFIAFDRQERGKETNLSAVQEFQVKYQIPVRAAATFNDLIYVVGYSSNEVQAILPKLLEYQKQYGVF